MTPSERTRRYTERKYAEIEAMPKIPCACGCGTLIPPINRSLAPARYARGHNPGGERTRFKPGDKPKPLKSGMRRGESNRGKQRTPEMVEHRTRVRREKYEGSYTSPEAKGWKLDDVAKAKMSEKAKLRVGPLNPFYGKTHTLETKARISESRSGENNPSWRGGCSTLPYGPEFTRKYKRMIRDRDGQACRRCGKTREENGRTLQVHHLDHDKTNNDPTNLVTACNSCNVWASYHRDEPFLPE